MRTAIYLKIYLIKEDIFDWSRKLFAHLSTSTYKFASPVKFLLASSLLFFFSLVPSLFFFSHHMSQSIFMSILIILHHFNFTYVNSVPFTWIFHEMVNFLFHLHVMVTKYSSSIFRIHVRSILTHSAVFQAYKIYEISLEPGADTICWF